MSLTRFKMKTLADKLAEKEEEEIAKLKKVEKASKGQTLPTKAKRTYGKKKK